MTLRGADGESFHTAFPAVRRLLLGTRALALIASVPPPGATAAGGLPVRSCWVRFRLSRAFSGDGLRELRQ